MYNLYGNSEPGTILKNLIPFILIISLTSNQALLVLSRGYDTTFVLLIILGYEFELSTASLQKKVERW